MEESDPAIGLTSSLMFSLQEDSSAEGVDDRGDEWKSVELVDESSLSFSFEKRYEFRIKRNHKEPFYLLEDKRGCL